MVNNTNRISSTFYLLNHFDCMKKTAKTRRDNKVVQRNIDWLRYKTRYLKKRAFKLLKDGNHHDNFIRYYYPHRYSVKRCIKRIGINQQVTKKVSSRFKNSR